MQDEAERVVIMGDQKVTLPPPHPILPRMPRHALRALGTVTGGICAVISLSTVDDTTGLHDYWIIPAFVLVGAARACPPGTRIDLRRPAAAVTSVLLGFLVVGILLGHDPWALAGRSLATVLATAIFICVYRAADRHRPWVPRNIADALWSMAACTAAAIGGTALGAFPPTPLGGSGVISIDIWNACWQLSIYAVTANCLFPLAFRREREVLRQMRPLWWPIVILISVTCIWGPDFFPEYPLDWFFVVPAMFVGALMTMRSACLTVLVIGVLWAVTPYADYPDTGASQLVPPEAVVDLVLGFITHISLVLVILRQRAAVLTADIRQRAQEAFSRESMLESVLTSSTDALLLTDREGHVVLGNVAAAGIADEEEPLPEQITIGWVRRLGLRNGERGIPLESHVLDGMLRPRPGRQSTIEVLVGEGAETTRFLVNSSQVDTGEEDLTLLMWREITQEYARQEQLEWFVASVAGELTTPLDSLDGHLDKAVTALNVPAAEEKTPPAADTPVPDSVQQAMDGAQDAVQTMRATIEDYLVRSVHVPPTALGESAVLADLAGEVTEVYSDPPLPTFHIETAHTVAVGEHQVRQLLATALAYGMGRVTGPVHADLISRTAGDGPVEVVVEVRGQQAPTDQDAAASPAPDPADDLGMAVCQAIVSRHGGVFDVAATSRSTTVTFTLPGVEQVR